jgi:hypothetical protein
MGAVGAPEAYPFAENAQLAEHGAADLGSVVAVCYGFEFAVA